MDLQLHLLVVFALQVLDACDEVILRRAANALLVPAGQHLFQVLDLQCV